MALSFSRPHEICRRKQLTVIIDNEPNSDFYLLHTSPKQASVTPGGINGSRMPWANGERDETIIGQEN